MIILYDFFYTIFALIYLPVLIVRGKFHGDFLMRFGKLPSFLKEKTKTGKTIWIHAVSVGEILTILKLVAEVKKIWPQHNIICSTVTTTGYTIAQEKLKDTAIVIYAPLDWSCVVKKYIRVIKPCLYIAAETELWPNLYQALHQSRIPIVIINGRISDQAFKGYQRFSFLVKNILKKVHCFCMQTDTDAKRIVTLGADTSKVQVLGNLKFDSVGVEASVKLESLGFNASDWLFIGGSTHPGEEEVLIEILGRLQKEFSHLRLVIAPRHIERASEIIRTIETKGFEAKRFSELSVRTDNSAKTIIVVDTIGHLKSLYNLATVVFVGKSLSVKGGQNIIEPASFGKAILVGPHMENFKDIMRIFLEAHAIIQVKNREELFREVENLLRDPQKRNSLGWAAKRVVEENKGATQRTVEVLKGLL